MSTFSVEQLWLGVSQNDSCMFPLSWAWLYLAHISPTTIVVYLLEPPLQTNDNGSLGINLKKTKTFLFMRFKGNTLINLTFIAVFTWIAPEIPIVCCFVGLYILLGGWCQGCESYLPCCRNTFSVNLMLKIICQSSGCYLFYFCHKSYIYCTVLFFL